MPVTEMLWNLDIKFQKRNKEDNTYIFCSKKSISLHVKDKNSIFTARGEDMIFS